MQTYNGWTELREYRVWACEDTYAVVTVTKHRNGWFHVYEDGSEEELKTRSEGYAYRYAASRAELIHDEAIDLCPCLNDPSYDQEERDACKDAARNVYGSPHGVRTQVVDMVENRSLDEWEL